MSWARPGKRGHSRPVRLRRPIPSTSEATRGTVRGGYARHRSLSREATSTRQRGGTIRGRSAPLRLQVVAWQSVGSDPRHQAISRGTLYVPICEPLAGVGVIGRFSTGRTGQRATLEGRMGQYRSSPHGGREGAARHEPERQRGLDFLHRYGAKRGHWWVGRGARSRQSPTPPRQRGCNPRQRASQRA